MTAYISVIRFHAITAAPLLTDLVPLIRDIIEMIPVAKHPRKTRHLDRSGAEVGCAGEEVRSRSDGCFGRVEDELLNQHRSG